MINIDNLLENHKGFFAFNKEQFDSQIDKNLIPYVRIGMGGYLPKRNYKNFVNDFDKIKKNNIEKEKALKTDYKIAFDLFMNYELQYTELEDEHVKTLENDYNIKPEKAIKYYKRFMSYCINNDLI